MRRIFLITTLLLSLATSAENNVLKQFLTDFKMIGGNVTILEEYEDQYFRLQLNDSATIEVFYCPPKVCDKVFVVTTVCAPQCSSCARVYNKYGEYLFPLEPTINSIFPLATIDPKTGRITWTDNDTWEY
ncbi:MAG: DUF3256 family protein [Paludibacteraceae bacterium]|nr:DUF3256 family protein [Paludibacteraceae bacterium]